MEILDYGIQPQSEKQCILPSPTIPPVLDFATGLECLQEKILTVLYQRKQTVFYDRSLGSDLDEIVWEDLNDDTLTNIKTTILDALTTEISDIIVDDVKVEKDSNDPSVVHVTVIVSNAGNQYTLKMNFNKDGTLQFVGA